MSQQLKNTIEDRYNAADTALSEKRKFWTEAENVLHNKLSDSLSATSKSKVFDPKLATIVLERMGRVMSQLPTGKVKAVSKDDELGAELLNLCLDKYVIPNANSQFDFLTKLRLMNLYSNVYGNYFAMVDWDVRKDGYVGPDLWLIDIWDVFHQVGAVSLEDSDYIIIRTWKSLKEIESLADRKSYKNIDEVITKLKDSGGDKAKRDSKTRPTRDQDEYSHTEASKGDGYYEVLTMYERDKWVDYIPRTETIIREIENPHEDGSLPIVNKYSMPLMNDFYGFGDFERGISMQKAINSLWNLYLDGVKMSIFPPVELNKNDIYPSTIKFGSAQKWLVKRSGAIRPVNLSPQGINTFNNTYQTLNATLLNMNGTTDTAVSDSTDPGFGKTPQALKMQERRENTRDNMDRFYMERTVESIMKKMITLISKKQKGSIKMRLFAEEISDLAQRYPELSEYYNEESGELTLDNGVYGNTVFDYEVISGSAHATDQAQQLGNLTQLLQVLPQLEERISQEGKKVNYGELVARIMSNSGITDWDKIVEDIPEEDQDMQSLDQDRAQLEQFLQQMGGIGGVPASPEAQQPSFNGEEQLG